MTKIQNLFLSLNIGISDLIGIWCLEFEILQCSTTPLLQFIPICCQLFAASTA